MNEQNENQNQNQSPIQEGGVPPWQAPAPEQAPVPEQAPAFVLATNDYSQQA